MFPNADQPPWHRAREGPCSRLRTTHQEAQAVSAGRKLISRSMASHQNLNHPRYHRSYHRSASPIPAHSNCNGKGGYAESGISRVTTESQLGVNRVARPRDVNHKSREKLNEIQKDRVLARSFESSIGAEGGTRTPTSYLTRPSNVRVYQFRHFG